MDSAYSLPEFEAVDPAYHCKVFSYPGSVVEVVTSYVPYKMRNALPAPPAKRKRDPDAVPSEDSIRRSVARARASVRRLALTIEVDRLLTLTYRDNVIDMHRAWKDFKRFARLVRSRYKQWRYVAVPERQGRGAVHFHIGIKGWQDVVFLRECWHRAIGSSDGNIDVKLFKPMKSGGARAVKIAGYISKYMGKGFEDGQELRDFGGHRYRASYGVKIVMGAHWLRATNWRDACRETLDVLRLAGVRPGGVMFADDWSVCWACGWDVEPPF